MKSMILGHNPFFGIHHGSQKAGIEKALHFQDTDNIVRFMEEASRAGIRKMMLSTHPLAIEVIDKTARSALVDRMTFYPLLPYMVKYVRKANEDGIMSMITGLFKGMGLAKGTSFIAKAGMSGLMQNPKGLIEAALDIEYNHFKKVHVERVFLHNALVDLAVGFQMELPIRVFKKFVEEKLGLKCGFGTLNLPASIRQFDEWGLSGEFFMAPFNKIGHQMNPGLKENLDALKGRDDIRILAMSTLASGVVLPNEAFAFLADIPNITEIVIGISSEKHLRTTVADFSVHSS